MYTFAIMKKSTKSALLNSLLVLCTILPEFNCQQPIAHSALVYPQAAQVYPQEAQVYPQQAQLYPQQAQVYPQQAQMYPQQAQMYPQDDMYGPNPAVKGYSNTAMVPGNYVTNPIHPQYWTGSQPFPQNQYGAQPYQQGVYYQQYPQQYYPQHYQQQYYSARPGFDAQYWTGNNPQYPAQPYYNQYPAYPHGAPAYYQAHPMHPGYYPMRKKGILGRSKVAKTLLGAVVVGAVAGAVARGK